MKSGAVVETGQSDKARCMFNLVIDMGHEQEKAVLAQQTDWPSLA
tara:strand:+ start:9224 stop:9358 length:135 start_codon:yes stop_codon:yes gene_type:complete